MMSSPYMNGREEWLERYGSYIQRCRHWRIVAFISLGVLCLSIAGNVVQGVQSKVKPYVVEVDQHGNIQAVGPADQEAVFSEKMIKAALGDLIVNWRTATADQGLQQRMIGKVAAHVTGAAKGLIKNWYQKKNPYELAKKKLVDVHLSGVPLPVSENSWRVEWLENTRNHSGVIESSQKYEATLTIIISPPTTEEQILRNPAGIYVSGLSFSKLLSQ